MKDVEIHKQPWIYKIHCWLQCHLLEVGQGMQKSPQILDLKGLLHMKDVAIDKNKVRIQHCGYADSTYGVHCLL